MRESHIERKVCNLAKADGWLTYKWASPGHRGVPDRIFIKDGVVVFIEFKAPGKEPTPLQASTIAKLRAQDMEVHVCDSVESGRNALSL